MMKASGSSDISTSRRIQARSPIIEVLAVSEQKGVKMSKNKSHPSKSGSLALFLVLFDAASFEALEPNTSTNL